ncbi:flavoprotein [Aeromicrobium sp. CF3.5]|uniref:flavoprotein n=1 Tax=Aeromicrobium sp. CF3.5 TaxID=3373078 RepID=UPI003EE78B47
MPHPVPPTERPLGTVLIGVCGSSAAVDTAALVDDAMQLADEVIVVATPAAAALFVSDDVRVVVHTDDEWVREPLHVTLLEQTSTLVVAPATATTLAKAAAGIADTLVTALICAHGPGVYFAPCMNARMWASPAVRRAVATLREDGHHVLEPGPMTSRARQEMGSGVGEIPGQVMSDVAELARSARA